MTGSLLPIGILVGIIIRRTGHFRWAIWLGWLISILSSGLLILFNSNTRVYAWVLILIVVGLGHGLILIALNICTQALADPADVGYAAAMYTFMRSIGMCIGVSVSGTILQNTLQTYMQDQNLDASMAGAVIGIISQLQDLPITMRKPIAIAIGKSCDNVAEFLLGIATLALFVSLLIKESSLNKEFKPDHVLEGSADKKRAI